MRKFAALAFVLLFPLVASAAITISPTSIAYNTDGAILTLSGSFTPGQVSTLVEFDQGDAFTQVPASTVSSTTITVEVPLAVTGIPGQWNVSAIFVDNGNVIRTDGPAVLTITANLPPVVEVPEVVVAEATSSSGANVSFTVGGFSFVDPPPAPTIVCSPASGSLFNFGTTNVTCTATDSFGSSSASFSVLVVDTTPPVLTVPASFVSSSQVVTFSASATDAVSGTFSATCSPASGSTFPIGVTQVNCSATDSHGNTGVASFFVSVQPPPPPTLSLPADFSVTTTDPNGIPVGWDASADQGATVVCNPSVGSVFPVGTTTVNCSATGIFNTTATGSFKVTVVLDDRPMIVQPGDIEVTATSPSGAVVTFTVTAIDRIDGTFLATCTPPSGSTFPIGRTDVQCSATNSRNVTDHATFHVIVNDPNGAPVLTLPDPIVVPADGPTGSIVTFNAFALDATDGIIQATCNPASGSLFPKGTTTVQCHATDSDGHTVSGSFTVTVDNTPPVITTPGNVIAEATGPGGAVVNFTVSAVDDVDGPVSVVCTPASGSQFPIGINTVTCTAHDSSGNNAQAQFNVTVRDTTPPTINVPGPITADGGATCSAVVTFTVTATDLVDGFGNDAVTCTPASGSTFQLGTTTVNCSATDAHGNTGHGSFTVTVVDTTPPTITSVTATPNNLWPDDHKLYPITIAVTATDNCDPSPVNRIVSVTSNQAINGPGDGNTSPDYVITGLLGLQLRAERTGNDDRTYTITVSSTDSSGNSTTATVTVTVSQTNNRHHSTF